MKQHPTDGTPIPDSAPVNNDNDGKTTAQADNGQTQAEKLGGDWKPGAASDKPGNKEPEILPEHSHLVTEKPEPTSQPPLEYPESSESTFASNHVLQEHQHQTQEYPPSASSPGAEYQDPEKNEEEPGPDGHQREEREGAPEGQYNSRTW